MQTLDILVFNLLAVLALLTLMLWAWGRYLLEQRLTPAVDLDIGCEVLGEKDGKKILEVRVRIDNKGSCTLVADRARLELRTIDADDGLVLHNDNFRLGQLVFPNVPNDDLFCSTCNCDKGYQLIPAETCVRSGVTHTCTFVTLVDARSEFLLARASFHCIPTPSSAQRAILQFANWLRLAPRSWRTATQAFAEQKAFGLS